jgi:hypothetical protein
MIESIEVDYHVVDDENRGGQVECRIINTFTF